MNVFLISNARLLSDSIIIGMEIKFNSYMTVKDIWVNKEVLAKYKNLINSS